ncbi:MULTISPECIES: hypothetical protein [Bacteria]|uniref:hypothetical protein n=1 Tax=Bacteria TaxID=2 RepID=UPI002E7B4340|nr:hypothetical protein [Cetobacterium somerae]WVJ03082.1 hypothetical protein VSU16_15230 [Cetobacterium somerae]
MDLKLTLDKLNKEIESLKSRKIRGEEQKKIVQERLTVTLKELLNITGTNTIEEAIEVAKELKKNFDKKENDLKLKCEDFFNRLKAV